MLLRIPATSANLGPGFDCIGMALNLYNYIEYEISGDEGYLSLEISGEGAKSLAKDKSNLVYQAFSRAFIKNNQKVPGIKLKLINNIPLARGLGSSSAAIIGGLMAANSFLNERLSDNQLLDLAMEFEGHPDNIAPALLGGIVLCTSNNGKYYYQKMDPPNSLCCSILIPDFQLSTKMAREVLPDVIPLKDAVFNVGKMGFFINAINTGNLELLKLAVDDKLHQPYRSQLIPGLPELFEKALNLEKILGTAISGAGPSIIIFHKEEDADALGQLKDVLLQHGTVAKLINLKPIIEGAQVL